MIAVAGVEILPETSTTVGQAAVDAVQSFAIRNLGNDTDTFPLTVAESVTGWNPRIILDDNSDGILDPGETTEVTTSDPLAPGGIQIFHLVVTVPGGAAESDSAVFTVRATSTVDSAVFEEGVYTFNVQTAVPNLVKAVVETPNIVPGGEVIYALTNSNTGSIDLDNVVTVDNIPTGTTYVPGSLRIGTLAGGYAAATPKTDEAGDDEADFNITNPGAVTFTEASIAAGATAETFFFKVQLDSTLTGGSTVFNQATTSSEVNASPLPDINADITITVEGVAGVDIEADQAQTVDPGAIINYTLTVENLGNVTDTFNITDASTGALTWTWYFAPAGSSSGVVSQAFAGTPLTDTDGDGIIDTGPIAAFGTVSIIGEATVPANAVDGGQDVTTVTASSITDTSVTDSVELTTTVKAPVLAVVKSVTPTGAQAPGTVLTYTVVTTNSGAGAATDVVMNDPIPQWTDYVANSLKTAVGGGALTARTDADDGDGAYYDSSLNQVITDPVDLGQTATTTLEFQVEIK